MDNKLQLTISTSPFVLEGATTGRLMREVLYCLVPVLATSVWFFGIAALLVVTAAICGALVTEWLFETRLGRSSLKDASALLTGLLLGLTLPPGVPLWIAFLGGFIAIALGKTIWGGLGNNLFNPALLGRAFLQAAFPGVMTTWSATPANLLDLEASTLAMPLMHGAVDGVSSATPLGLSRFQGEVTDLAPMFLGRISGSLGETSALILIVCGLWLGLRRVFDWRTPVAALLAVALFSGLLHLILPDRCPPPQFMLLAGGLLFGVVFMVTDPVTTPITSRGMWVFGFGVGFLVVLIRTFGGLPEGVMYAILLMNAVTPHINRFTQPRHFGG